MKIGELSNRTTVPTKTIRYYEEIGLLEEPARSANGYRDYDEMAVDRLKFIRDAQATGLSLAEIASLLEMRDHGEQTCGHVVDLLESHLADIDRQIRQLRRTQKLLKQLTARAQSLDPSDCVDPNRCQTIGAGTVATPSVRSSASHAHRSPTPPTHS